MTHSNYVIHPHTQWRRREGALSSVFVWTSAWILNQRWRGGGGIFWHHQAGTKNRRGGIVTSFCLCLFARIFLSWVLFCAFVGGVRRWHVFSFSLWTIHDEVQQQQSARWAGNTEESIHYESKSGRRYLFVHMLLIIWYMFNDDVLCGTWGVPGLMLDGSWSVYW